MRSLVTVGFKTGESTGIRLTPRTVLGKILSMAGSIGTATGIESIMVGSGIIIGISEATGISSIILGSDIFDSLIGSSEIGGIMGGE